jgi:hypothetical protein
MKLQKVRSKARVKRILKRFGYDSDTIPLSGFLGAHKTRPVGWMEIVAHNIKQPNKEE